MIWLILALVYVAGALQVWRHVGWWARNKFSSCIGNDCHIRWPSIDKECSHCKHNLCKTSAIWDYGWTLAISIAFAWLVVAVWVIKAVDRKYGLTNKKVGFFKPSPLVESREDKIKRLEAERIKREAYIRKLEVEAGIR